MLATPASRLPEGAAWAYEFKWDGVRAVAGWDGRRLMLRSRLGNDITSRYPELQIADQLLGSYAVLLDGEVIAVGSDGRPSFSLLQNRMHLTDGARIRSLMRTIPCAYLIFDLLWLDGRDITPLPYLQRRELLDSLGLIGHTWNVPAHHLSDGVRVLQAARAAGLEGVVAKRLDSAYQPGRRSPHWVKVRLDMRQEFVVGGWTPGQGGREGEIGALLVGYYQGEMLRFAGKVGTGFDRAENARLLRQLRALQQPGSPFADGAPGSGAHFARPVLVVEVKFTEWTGDGRLRHPSYQGQRDDKSAHAVRRET